MVLSAIYLLIISIEKNLRTFASLIETKNKVPFSASCLVCEG